MDSVNIGEGGKGIDGGSMYGLLACTTGALAGKIAEAGKGVANSMGSSPFGSLRSCSGVLRLVRR